ncbi:MAG: D-alanine--D-alanine ligase family protein [bacterium]|jgi:D-alanine-D-alanine ligase
MSLHVALLYSQNEIDGTTEFQPNPHGAIQMDITVEAIHAALLANGHQVTKIPAGYDLPQRMLAVKPDVIFNASTGIAKKTQQANVVAMLELLDIPFVGSRLATHVLGLYKQVTKLIFANEGIPTPNFQVFMTGKEPLKPELDFPLIVKPEHEGSSIGITPESIVDSEEELRRVLQKSISAYRQRALVEEYISGREFTLGILGNHDPVVLPVEEIIFRPEEGIHRSTQTYDIKERDAVNTKCPADLTAAKRSELEDYALRAYRAMECRGYARMDVRMDEAGTPYFLEVNTLPGMQPDYSDFPRMAVHGGYSFQDLVERLIELAMESE